MDRWVGIGDGIWSSATGAEWESMPIPLVGRAWVGSIAADDEVMVVALDPDPVRGSPHAMSDGNGDQPLVLWSRDGTEWHRAFRPAPTGGRGQVRAVFSDADTIWAVGETADASSGSKAAAWTTADGSAWNLTMTETGWDPLVVATVGEDGPMAITRCGRWVRPDRSGVWREIRPDDPCRWVVAVVRGADGWLGVGESGQAVRASRVGPFVALLDADLDRQGGMLSRMVSIHGIVFALGRSMRAPLWCSPVRPPMRGQPAACVLSGSETVPS